MQTNYKSNKYFLGGLSGGDAASAGTAAASGALAGAAILPPFGAIAGGLIGGATSLLGSSASNKAKRAQEKANMELGKYNTQTQIDALSQNNNRLANGGKIINLNKGFNTFETGGTHEANPFGGVPISLDEQGKPNLIEEDETMKDSYVFSNRLKLDVSEPFKLDKSFEGKSYSEISKSLNKGLSERPNDAISNRTFDQMTNRLKSANDYSKELNIFNNSNQFQDGGDVYKMVAGDTLNDIAASNSNFSNYNDIVKANPQLEHFAKDKYTKMPIGTPINIPGRGNYGTNRPELMNDINIDTNIPQLNENIQLNTMFPSYSNVKTRHSSQGISADFTDGNGKITNKTFKTNKDLRNYKAKVLPIGHPSLR